jgi:hypothetical protein
VVKVALAISLATLVCTVAAGSAFARTGSAMDLTCLRPGQITLYGIPRTATRVRLSFSPVLVAKFVRGPGRPAYVASVKLVNADVSTKWFPRSRFKYGQLSIRPGPGHTNLVAGTADAQFGHGWLFWSMTKIYPLMSRAAATVQMKSGRLLHVSATGCEDPKHITIPS